MDGVRSSLQFTLLIIKADDIPVTTCMHSLEEHRKRLRGISHIRYGQRGTLRPLEKFINNQIQNREDSMESWSNLIDPDTVLQTTAAIEGWPEYANRLIQATPKSQIHDFKLMWREPQPCWTSSTGRVIQIGDAAHTFLPSSGNGATQGMEDAISLATCLQIAGKDNVHWATRVHNKLRFVNDSFYWHWR